MRVLALEKCPGCGSTDAGTFQFGPDLLRRCAACQLVYASQYADPDEVFVEGYLTADTQFGPNITHPLFQRFLVDCANQRLDVIERHAKRGSLLDIGCGLGDLLSVAKERGWDCVGVEPMEESARIANERGLDVRAATLAESGLPQRNYDVVTAFHVLEHMVDGHAFLRSITQWVRPGGLLMIEVPNWRSVIRRNTQASWIGLRSLEHVAHYQPSTLKTTLEGAGLQNVRVGTLSFLSPLQSADQVVADLGLARLRRLFSPGSKHRTIEGVDMVAPGRAAWLALNLINRIYNLGRVGMVTYGVGRVP